MVHLISEKDTNLTGATMGSHPGAPVGSLPGRLVKHPGQAGNLRQAVPCAAARSGEAHSSLTTRPSPCLHRGHKGQGPPPSVALSLAPV